MGSGTHSLWTWFLLTVKAHYTLKDDLVCCLGVAGTLCLPPPIKIWAFNMVITGFSHLIFAPFVHPSVGKQKTQDPLVNREGPQPMRNLSSDKLLDHDQLHHSSDPTQGINGALLETHLEWSSQSSGSVFEASPFGLGRRLRELARIECPRLPLVSEFCWIHP